MAVRLNGSKVPAAIEAKSADGERIADSVTVVLPCLNEEDSVGLVVEEALRTLDAAGIPCEVLVVDNGSRDRSVEAAIAAGATVIHEERRGYGRAVRSGIAAATGTIVVMADADCTYDMSKLPLLIGPIQRDEADLVMGSRLHEATRRTMPILHKYLGTPALTAFIRTAGGYSNLTDSQSGFRCFRKQTILRLKLAADGMELTSEMLLKSSRHNLRVVEVPTGYRHRMGVSKLNTFADGWRNLKVLVLLAPEIFVLVPGAALFLFGAVLTTAGLLPFHGIQVGSTRWQPIFFATIALVLGLQTMLVGLIFLWRRAVLTGRTMGRGYRFISAAAFPRVCATTGVGALLAGFGLDGLLFVKWIQGRSNLDELPIASFAQSLVLVGGSLASFGLVVMWLHWDRRQNQDAD
jgi:glycosyltransferase involved in cell wall biosynthesis